MNRQLHILHLEDEPDFAELVSTMLTEDSLDVKITRVGDKQAFVEALERETYDLILSDFHLPSFTGLDALTLAKKKCPETPFILISGTIGETTAVESLKAGATDYLLKQKPERLPSAVRRAVDEAVERLKLRQTEEELRHSEKQYRLLFQENPNPMWVFDMESMAILEVNEAAVQHYGYPRDEFLKLTMNNLRVQEKNGSARGMEEKLELTEHNTRGHIWRHRRKRGDVIEVDVTWSPMAFQGRFSALAMATDVTERRRGDHRNSVFLKLSHRLSTARTAVEAADIIGEAANALFEWDNFALDLYNAERPEIVSLLNITMKEGERVKNPSSGPKSLDGLTQRVIRAGPELVSSGISLGNFACGMLAPMRRGAQVIGLLWVQSRRAGAYDKRDLATLEMLAGECGGALERVRVEEALRETQRRFRDLFENSPDAIFVDDLKGNVLDVNYTASQLHGVPREQLIGKNTIEHHVPPNRREEMRRDFERLATGKISRVESESLIAGGRVTPVEIRANLVQYEGQPALLLHVRDVTERRATQTALQSSETLFRSVWESSADGMRLTDENGIIVAVNNAFCKLVGLIEDELVGKAFTVIYSATESTQQMMEDYRNNYSNRELKSSSEYQYTLHNGREVVLEVLNSFVELHGQPQLTLSLFRDITAQRRLEEQFRQSQKMEAIGQLAGGVAHDFNNILTVIQGHASLLATSKLGEMEEKSANQIMQAASRAAGLTRQLLTFSRRQLIQPKRLDMNKIVGNMTNMLGRLLGEDVALQLNYCQAPPIVEADAGMMEQILLNLAVNARDAMPKGGQLAIRITVIDVDEHFRARQPDARKGEFVCISVSDTGTGIAPENRPRIFEPFFTTKQVGKGTGLGLATVYGIVKQHQGWIELDSHVGKGTTFRIYMPHVATEKGPVEKPTTAITVRGGSETILLVEDEKPVRELVARVLERYGYKIYQAETGVEAFEVWKSYKKDIRLVLTDLVMPNNMNGRELAEKMWAEAPGLKVIFTSGYSADIVGKDFRLEPELNFLQKPYQPQALALTIRRCLDGKQK